MTAIEKIANALIWLVAGIAILFLLAPLAITIAVSLGDSAVFTLPPPGWSLRWYERLPATRGLAASLWTSVQIAGLSTLISLVLGTLCAIALVRGSLPGREAIATFLVSPLMLPGLVVGIAMLQGFRAFGLRDAWMSLLVAHVVITMPYVVRTVLAALSLFDFTLIEAARTLGCNYGRRCARCWCRRSPRPSSHQGCSPSSPRWTITRSRSSSPTPGPRRCRSRCCSSSRSARIR